jgi:hypothetical protein
MATMGPRALSGFKEYAFARIAAKVQTYVELSLALRREYTNFGGLPPSELATNSDGQLAPVLVLPNDADRTWTHRIAAIDQQRQLYAAARMMLIDPSYGERILREVTEWHDAFVRNFIIDGNMVRASITFRSVGGPDRHEPDPQANLRFTYALQGSATLARALRAVAERSSDRGRSSACRAKADEIEQLALDIAEQFFREYADSARAGRYYLYSQGQADDPELRGLSHNNSQSYLIEGMVALASLDAATWQPRLDDLLAYIETRRDEKSGLLHEFDFLSGAFNSAAAGRSEFSWQVQENHETVILGHTIAGLYAGPGRTIASSSDPHRKEKMTGLVQDFVETVNKVGGIHENGLLANAYQLVPGADPAFVRMDWPEGAWQVELLWQFLMQADRSGVRLGDFIFQAGNRNLTLDRLLVFGLRFHDQKLFDGSTYVTENGKPLTGRVYAAPINGPSKLAGIGLPAGYHSCPGAGCGA